MAKKSMVYKDYYKILEVKNDATKDEIKKSYRRLAMIYHPDKNEGDPIAEEKFKEIVEAYEVLGNIQKRYEFDKFSGNKTAGSTKTKSSSDSERNTTNSQKTKTEKHEDNYWNDLLNKYKTNGFSDFFKNFFENESSENIKKTQIKGKITIDLEEAYNGSVRILTLKNKKIRLLIKPGIEDEKIILVKEQSEDKASSQKSDMFIRIVIKPHDNFKRVNNDLFTDLNVDIYTIMLGEKINLKTLKGEININIPQGTPYGKTLRLKGLGMPQYEKPSEYGDLYVNIYHKIPAPISETERQLLKQLYDLNKN